MAIYIKYGALKGEVTAQGYTDYFEATSLQYGVGRGISMGAGGGSKREATAPSVSEIQVSKTLDAISPFLYKEALGGKGSDVEIHLTQTDDGGKHIPFQIFKLNGTLISGYSMSSGGDRPTESLSFNFAKIESTYMKIDEKFKSEKAGTVIYDLAKALLS
jgi:type VI secretion system secreted protein Hcp